MRHRRKIKLFSRKFNARKALLRGLMVSLVEHERIKTTVDKAKELRRHIEPAITLGKKEDLATRRLLISRIANEGTVDKILRTIAPRFKARPGGYTRIIKIGRRPGDTTEMAFIEFVDYDFKNKPSAIVAAPAKGKAAEADAKKVAKAKAKAAKVSTQLVAAKRKNIRKIQGKSRAASAARRA